jgi:hypothetical protein
MCDLRCVGLFFVANMCVRQNALDLSIEFPLAARAVEDDFYVEDGLTGAD